MSVENVNAQISAATTALEKSRGAEDQDHRAIDLFGVGTAEKKLGELKDQIVTMVCITPGTDYYPMTASAEEASQHLGGVFDGSTQTETVEAAHGAIARMGEKAQEARDYHHAGNEKRDEIYDAIGALATRLSEYGQIMAAQHAAVDSAAANRENAITALQALHI
jgi:plasmid stabilization system protein ParE